MKSIPSSTTLSALLDFPDTESFSLNLVGDDLGIELIYSINI